MKSLKDFNYSLSLDRRYTKTESEIFRSSGLRLQPRGSLCRKPHDSQPSAPFQRPAKAPADTFGRSLRPEWDSVPG